MSSGERHCRAAFKGQFSEIRRENETADIKMTEREFSEGDWVFLRFPSFDLKTRSNLRGEN